MLGSWRRGLMKEYRTSILVSASVAAVLLLGLGLLPARTASAAHTAPTVTLTPGAPSIPSFPSCGLTPSLLQGGRTPGEEARAALAKQASFAKSTDSVGRMYA